MSRVCFLILSTLFLSSSAVAEDWPRWRGPDADGAWNGAELSTDWPKDGLKQVWKQQVGGGYSGVAVADGIVYLQDYQAEPKPRERLLAFAQDTGKLLFSFEYTVDYEDKQRGKLDYASGPRSTPTIHGEFVYILGATGKLNCLNRKTGAVVWQKDLVDDLHGRMSMWGYAASPFIHKDALIVQPGGDNGWHVVALDKQTGEILWHSLSDTVGYATPVLTQHAGKPLAVLWTPSHIRGIDPTDGTPRWEVPYEITYGVSIADPIIHDDLVYISGYWDGAKAIRLGDTYGTASLEWEDKRWLRGLMSQPIQRNGYGYQLDKSYGLTCFDLETGKKQWDDGNSLTPRGRNPQASLVWQKGTDRCVALNSDGELVLTRLTPEKPTELGRAKIIGETWAHPAYTEKHIFARSDTELVCVELPTKQPQDSVKATSRRNPKSETEPVSYLAEGLRVASFEVDVSPPIGSPVAYIETNSITDPISARGIVLLGAGKPLVMCAVDYLGIGNTGHDAWREKLADAAGTDPSRVTVHTLHQHDAPRCDFLVAELLGEADQPGKSFDMIYTRDVLNRVSKEVKESLTHAGPVTHLGLGTAKVKKVASNRRLLGEDGKVKIMRFSSSRNPEAIAAPEGVIDPVLSLVTFYNEDNPVAALTWYATHPQSYYGKGDVTCEFVGIARNQREKETGVPHIHFNGASGNIAAGKYNNGSHKARIALTEKMAAGMKTAWENTKRVPITASDIEWSVAPVALPLGAHLVEEKLRPILENESADKMQRLLAAKHLAFLKRSKQGHKIDLTCLKLGDAYFVGMPGELFVEYQLAAKAMRPDDFVTMAAYGDYGPGYIGTEISYSQGGYETSERASRVSSNVEKVLLEGLRTLLQPDDQ